MDKVKKFMTDRKKRKVDDLQKALHGKLPSPGPLYDGYFGDCPNCGRRGSAGDLPMHLKDCLAKIKLKETK